MITRQEILDRTKAIIYESAPELEGMELNGNTVINTDAALDSMGFVYLIVKIEGEFGVKVPERKWSKLKTVGDVADAILLEMK